MEPSAKIYAKRQIQLTPLFLVGLCLILLGCGRGTVPQQTKVIEKHTYDTIYIAPSNDFAIGDDCSQYAEAIDKANDLIANCNNEVNGLLDENEGLKEQLTKEQKKKRGRDKPCPENINIKAKSGSNVFVNSPVDSSTINAEKGKDKAKDGAAIGEGNTATQTKECKDRFWLGVLVTLGAIQALRFAKRKLTGITNPAGMIAFKILNLIV